ncbi:MAG: cation-transporting P-type ATPase [Promethearchaeota archaeon]|nr:MAG: cation-transporting P-type ATPase [Candidatus Lokiarchaeota archaeon]
MKKNNDLENINFHELTEEGIIDALNSNREQGLRENQVLNLFEKYGYNEIPRKKGSLLKAILPQVFDYVIIILLICAVILLIFSFIDESVSITSSLLIFGVVILNSWFVIAQLYRAEKSLEKLQQLTAHKAIVIREGKKTEIQAKELVPGDIVILNEGDYIPADIRIIENINIFTDESSLTGESLPVEKTTKPLKIVDPNLSELKNIALNGTMLVKGNGKGIVIRTGVDTFLGKIASGIKEMSLKEVPLQRKMKQMGRMLGFIVVLIVVILFIMQISTMAINATLTLAGVGNRLYQMVSLVVAAVPWNFPLIITLVLLRGIINMAKRNVIVRKLASIESLGRISVVCSDKTGTITKNEMTIKAIWFDNKIYSVEGIGYEPVGNIIHNDKIVDPLKNEYFKKLLLSGLLNVNASLIEEDGKYKISGDPTEGCLIVLAKKSGLNLEHIKKFEFKKELPFDSKRMLMSKVFQNDKNDIILFIKGSVENLVDRSSNIYMEDKIVNLNQNLKDEILNNNRKLNSQAYRTLGIGYKLMDKIPEKLESDRVENQIIFLGIVGMIDPPKENVNIAVNTCKDANIKPIMITGDAKETAKSIAEEVGIYEEGDMVVEGRELQDLSYNKYNEVSVFSRVSPEDKTIIIEGFQKSGNLIAMTGDGINDAAALEMADTGVSMGSGTDVAKNASDIVITDDNFSTIIDGIKQGRGIFNNIRKCVMFQLVNNFAELAIMVFFIIFFGVTLKIIINGTEIYLWDVFNPTQLFVFYLTTHTFPILALILDPYDKNIMKLPPRDPKEGIISKNVIIQLILQVLSMGVVVCITFYFANITSVYYTSSEPLIANYYHSRAQTMAFITLFLAETWNVFNVRTNKESIFSNYLSNWILIGLISLNYLILLFLLLSNFGQNLLSFVLINPLDWLLCFALSFLVLVVLELYKYILRKKSPYF